MCSYISDYFLSLTLPVFGLYRLMYYRIFLVYRDRHVPYRTDAAGCILRDVIHVRVYLLILVWKCVDVLFLCVSTWHTSLETD